jgi:hypothetical protein
MYGLTWEELKDNFDAGHISRFIAPNKYRGSASKYTNWFYVHEIDKLSSAKQSNKRTVELEGSN